MRFILGLSLVVFPVVEVSGKVPVSFAENYDGDRVAKTRNNQFPRSEWILLLFGPKPILDVLPHQDDDNDGAGGHDGEKHGGDADQLLFEPF